MFPKRIDNTIRSAFVTCPQQAKYAYVDDLSPTGDSVHLHAGGAFAAGLEATRRAFYEKGLPAPEAVRIGQEALAAYYGDFQAPAKSPKTRANMVEALAYYFAHFPLATDPYRPQAMEWRFEVPIPDLVHPDDGGPIMYCGRPDTYGTISEGLTVVEDDKTATSLGSQWAKQWALDSQFTGYWWAGQQLGVLPLGSSNPVLIRGCSILTPKFKEIEVPAGTEGAEPRMVSGGRGKPQVEKWFGQEYNREESFGHSQALVYRPQWMIERWLLQLQRDVRRMIYAYENNEWDLALHKGACAAYGGCSYVQLCESQDPEKWIPLNYVKRKWNPMETV